MPEPRAEVRNAADSQQVRRAGRRQQRRDERRQNAVRAVLATPEGRFVFWDLIASAGVFRSIWESSARIHYNAGRQDFGHELIAMLVEADPEAYQLMEREMRALAKRDALETDASHTDSAIHERIDHA